MNNKGFAITTILYGIMVLFCILLVSLLGLLASYKKAQNLLVDNTNGTRDIVKIKKYTREAFDKDRDSFCNNLNGMSKTETVCYCDIDSNCIYLKVNELINNECS